ncbi:MAG: hypothetical protein R6V02_12650 [Candidatus Aminicenantes bacterium]
MKQQKYNFEIIYEKLEKVKREQNQIKDSDLKISKDISEQIRKLKECYDDLSQELETYKGS